MLEVGQRNILKYMVIIPYPMLKILNQNLKVLQDGRTNQPLQSKLESKITALYKSATCFKCGQVGSAQNVEGTLFMKNKVKSALMILRILSMMMQRKWKVRRLGLRWAIFYDTNIICHFKPRLQ